MITEQQWATFAKHVRPGTLIKFSLWDDGDGSEWVYGYLASPTPTPSEFLSGSGYHLLSYTPITHRCADDDIRSADYLAEYMRFWVWDGWYSFDDIYTVADEDDLPFSAPVHDDAWDDDLEALT